jgi:predicted SAM-dependent methyltransferase
MKNKIKKKVQSILGNFWWDRISALKRTLLFEYSVQKGIFKSKKTLKKLPNPFKLQLGSGPFPKNGWLNTDIFETEKCKPDAILDLRRPLPFSDMSCSEIYSNHVFEHLPYPHVAGNLLREAYRILLPEGCFRVVVPDLDAFLETYQMQKQTDYSKWVLSLNNHTVYLRTRAEVINLFFRQWGEHHFAYDFETLSKLIYNAGFRIVEKSEYNQDIDTIYREESIYLNAYK